MLALKVVPNQKHAFSQLCDINQVTFLQIITCYRSQTNLKAITDMWTSLNVSSRLEAAEEGIGKLSSLVQDLISEASTMQDTLKRRPTAL